MTRAFRVLAAFCVLLLGTGASAKTAPPVHFRAAVAPAPVHPGEVATVSVTAAIDPGWHVYSVVPTPNGPAATQLVSAGGWRAVGPTTEDRAIRQMDPNFGQDVGYHETTATFSRQFRVPSEAMPDAPLTVTLHYQTCNDKICLPPTDVTVTTAASVTPGLVRAAFARPAPVSAAAVAGTHSGDGLTLFLLAALGAGLLAILTPCVFPLIPITLTSFVKQADGDKGKLVRLSFGYALGIVALYVVLGGLVSATLGAAGVNQVAANPWVNLAEFVVFVVFALSFFETITLQLPANLGALQSRARRHGGTLGLVLLGTTFVLASFTCTAPFIGTLLVAAAGGQKVRPLLGTLVFALAFVSPFLVFAAFPQWISRIPKSGAWLARVKATLGFLELAAALKFLSNADQVWQWRVLTQPVLLAAWAVIFVLAALYLTNTVRFGVVAETEPVGAPIPPARRAFAGAFLLAALYCFWGLAGRPLSPYVAAFLPPSGYGGAGPAPSDGLPWLSDYEAALTQAKAENKPLLIDFTGYTCTNCRLNEKRVFPQPDVQKKFADYVRVQLYTDGGKDGPKNQKLQEAKFGDVALPLYGVVDPRTEAVVGKTAGVQSVGGFTAFLARSQAALSHGGAPPSGETATQWAAYTPAGAAQAAAQGRPTVIDFTAAWCVNCKEIEHDVFENPSVAPALGRDFVTLRADLTKWGDPASVALQKQYGFVSLPTIVFLDKSGKELKDLRITGRLSVADFQRRMQKAAGTATQVAAEGNSL